MKNGIIKYRAWDKKAKRMFMPDGLKNPVNFTDNIEHMQFTRLKDVKGKEIYEGDILEITVGDNFYDDGSDMRLVVEWGEDETTNEWCLFLPETEDYEAEISGNVSLHPLDIKRSGLKVIGNKYENSKLLK